MILVYKTNIKKIKEANKVKQLILEHFPNCQVDFDLEDCDNILRIETNSTTTKSIEQLVQTTGYFCQELY